MQNKETKKTASAPKQKGPLAYIIGSVLILVVIIIGFVFIFSKSTEVNYKTVKIGAEVFRLEVSDDEATRTQGLSERDSLDKNQGMLFDFKESGDWRIWMLKMRFPIDIAWLAKDGKIITIKNNAEPGSYPELYKADAPSWYVIEVPAGTFERLGVKIGDVIKL
jgi:uncharacterized protein